MFVFCFRYNAKRRHWGRTKLGFWLRCSLLFYCHYFFSIVSKHKQCVCKYVYLRLSCFPFPICMEFTRIPSLPRCLFTVFDSWIDSGGWWRAFLIMSFWFQPTVYEVLLCLRMYVYLLAYTLHYLPFVSYCSLAPSKHAYPPPLYWRIGYLQKYWSKRHWIELRTNLSLLIKFTFRFCLDDVANYYKILLYCLAKH